MWTAGIFTFLLYSHARAHATVPVRSIDAVPTRGRMQIYILDDALDRAKVRAQFRDADVYTDREAEVVRRSVVLPLDRQAQFFERAKLKPVTDTLSHFDRDMLVRRLRFTAATKVHEKFRQISVVDARRAQEILNSGYFLSK